MWYHRFSTGLVRSFLSMLLFTLLFVSFVNFDTKEMLTGVFADIYDHANPDAQETAVSNADVSCDKILYRNINFTGLNKEMLQDTCRAYENGTLSDRDYFLSITMSLSVLPKSDVEKTNSKLLAIPTIAVILLLLLALYFLQKKDFRKFLSSIGRIFIGVGFFALALYYFPILYAHYFPPDTSFILSSVGENNPQLVSEYFLTLLPFIFGRLITLPFMIFGWIFFIGGIVLKIAFRKHI